MESLHSSRGPSDEMFVLECPHCGAPRRTKPRGGRVSYPEECVACSKTFWVESVPVPVARKTLGLRKRYPAFKGGEEVYIINRGHEFHLQPAVVVQRDHVHCRVRIVRNGKPILVWISENCLQRGF